MATPAQNNTAKTALVAVIVLIIAVLAYGVLTMPDERSGAERLGDAISELPNGVDNAAEQLEDRTPGEKLGDAVEDAGDDVGESISNATDGK